MAMTDAQVRAYLEPEEPDYKAAAAALGAGELPVLQSIVQGSDPLLASKAAYLASLIPDKGAARVLEQAARSPHATVRVAAAAGLQKRPDIADEVAAELMSDHDQGVRKVAAKAARGRRAAQATLEGRTAPKAQEDEHGGGAAPATPPGAEEARGEGGGDVGGQARGRADDESQESGGGGDLGTSTGLRGHTQDAPDGGGVIDNPTILGGRASGHGGGQV